MSTERVLLESRIAVKTAMENEFFIMVIAGLLLIGTFLTLIYVEERWSWIPRKKQRRGFNEKF